MKQNLQGISYFTRLQNRQFWWQIWRPKYKYVKCPTVETPSLEDTHKGRITKVKTTPEYSPSPTKGGRVTRVMPRTLRRLKEEQEKATDVSNLPG